MHACKRHNLTKGKIIISIISVFVGVADVDGVTGTSYTNLKMISDDIDEQVAHYKDLAAKLNAEIASLETKLGKKEWLEVGSVSFAKIKKNVWVQIRLLDRPIYDAVT